MTRLHFFSGGGGQVPDSGKIFDLNNNLLALVVDGFKIAYNQMYYKIQLVDNNVISVNDNVIQNIDEDKRNKASQNHTALHLFADVLLTESNNVLVEKSANLNEDYFVIRYIYNEMFTDEFLKKSLAKAQSYLKEDHNQKEVWLSFEEALEKKFGGRKIWKSINKRWFTFKTCFIWKYN
ncbi:hypothetical protein NPX79_03205 [Spiroplasma endosymbiont of Anurida maritima]|uniref:hypothetical protein n=1 Tax=Spiroplasma endosymbiont of Anurida maritima TaxID=2967972 RepID=UPI0036D34FB5